MAFEIKGPLMPDERLSPTIIRASPKPTKIAANRAQCLEQIGCTSCRSVGKQSWYFSQFACLRNESLIGGRKARGTQGAFIVEAVEASRDLCNVATDSQAVSSLACAGKLRSLT